MKFFMIGCRYDAPLEVRECLAFSPGQIAETLARWEERFPNLEAVLLSTCNRTELYYANRDDDTEGSELADYRVYANKNIYKEYLEEQKATDPPDLANVSSQNAEIARFLLDARRIPHQEHGEILRHLDRYSAQDAVRHLFTVASSLDSMVLGEPQIIAQVRTAYQTALAAGTIGTTTHGVFQAAIKTAKRITTETSIQQHRISIPSVAVGDFVLRLFETLADRTTLVLGAGEMAEETLRYLKIHGANTIFIANRSTEKAEEMAKRWNGSPINWGNHLQHLETADLAIGTTGAPHPIVTLEDFEKIKHKRKGKPLFLLDLALPRDFDPRIGSCPDVYLYSIDDLKEACEENRQRRLHELPQALQIIDQESERFARDLHHRQTGDMIRRLREQWEETKEAEVVRLLNKLWPLGPDPKEEEEIRYAFERLVNKLLHPPLESLRNESQNGVPHGLIDALARLFRLR